MLLFLFWEGQTLCDLKRRQLNNNRRRFGPEINEKQKKFGAAAVGRVDGSIYRRCVIGEIGMRA